MKTVRDCSLHTTLFDDELSANAGNNTDVLKCLVDHFKRQFPRKFVALQKEHFPGGDNINSSDPAMILQLPFVTTNSASQKSNNLKYQLKRPDEYEVCSIDHKLKFLQSHHTFRQQMT